MRKLLLLLIFTFSCSVFGAPKIIPFKSKIQPIPKKIRLQMQRYSWHADCPVPIKNLAYVALSYWGFDHKPHQGVLIVNKNLSKEVVKIFKKLYEKQFPIHSMLTIDHFRGNDNAAMNENNTSAFNCRAVTGHPGIYSQHSYGRAIDINPLINPFVKNNEATPAAGKSFIPRNRPYPGKITKNSYIYKLFTENGWDWGGHWQDVQDNQHFEKRANGEKRNPQGYG